MLQAPKEESSETNSQGDAPQTSEARLETDSEPSPNLGVQVQDHVNAPRTTFDPAQIVTQSSESDGFPKLERPRTRTLGKLKMRSQFDHDPTDWWFASTAIPLVAATFAPMANLLSIAALVVSWRNDITHFDDPKLKYTDGVKVPDPSWCYNLNAISLACGFIGNLFLLFNFTQRVRYIIALPVTIVFFYLASGILIGIIVSMDRYTPPDEDQVYSQGYWHAVIAACLYLLNSMILMVNMAGYFLGHYPQHFTLTDEQRNLILQTMLFFVWLGGGAGVFARTEGWTYPDALYFCDVTILTIGFGDYFASRDLGRGLVFPFSVGGTIILGLMVNSIHKFARELSKEKVVRKHIEHRRVNTLSRAIALDELDDTNLGLLAEGKMINISSPLQGDKNRIQQRLDELAQRERDKRKNMTSGDEKEDYDRAHSSSSNAATHSIEASSPHSSSPKRPIGHTLLQAVTLPITMPVSVTADGLRRMTTKKTKKILMIEERDRFNAMRRVQIKASRFNRYYALSMSILSFGMLWCLGAMVFYFAEAETQQLNYFQGLYFCYVSLLTIGYGDLSPKSNAGKAFFVVWSLIAVPTMTILVSDLGDTVIGGFKRGVLQNDLGLTSSSSSGGRTSSFFRNGFRLTGRQQTKQHGSETSTSIRLQDSLEKANQEDEGASTNLPTTIDGLVEQDLGEPEMMKRLAFAIRRTAEDLRNEPGKKYKYEDWVEFTRLIRFSKVYASGPNSIPDQLEYDEANDGIVEWDWLDDKSPMTSEQTESEWVLDRLCESLLRIFKTDSGTSILSAYTSRHSSPVDSRNIARGPHTKDKQNSDTANPLKAESSTPVPTRTGSMSAMTRLFQGEAGDGALKWSRRAHARRKFMKRDHDRRRSSTSDKHKRCGPFATSNQDTSHDTMPRNVRHQTVTKTLGLGIETGR